MKNRLLIGLLVVLMALSCMLSACGENSDKSTDNGANPDSAVYETTVVLETTSDGGTIEQDSEGNQITKDDKGKVTSVKDKNGNNIDVTEYLTTHSWVEDNGSVSNNSSGSSSGSGSKSNSSGSSKSDNSKSSQGGSDKGSASSGSNSEEKEEEIPVVIATVPDEDEMETLADFK